MAKLENGYLKIANEIVDFLCRYRIPGEEMLCLWVIIRKTYGWNKKADYISLTQFEQLTELKRANVIRALKSLQSKNIVTSIKSDTRGINKYLFNKDYSKWTASIKKDTTSINTDNKVVSKAIPTKDNIQKTYISQKNFEAFWINYPKKRNKATALKVFKKINPDNTLLQIILKKVNEAKQTEQWKQKLGQFIPYPATWLNAQGWLDEYQVLDEQEYEVL